MFVHSWIKRFLFESDAKLVQGLNEEVEEELLFHIATRKDKLVDCGLAEEEAQREAEAKFGDFFYVRDQCLRNYSLGRFLAFRRSLATVSLAGICIFAASYATARWQPISKVDERLNRLFADIQSDSIVAKDHAIESALHLAEVSEIQSLRKEIYRQIMSCNDPRVVGHLTEVAKNENYPLDVRLVAIDTLSSQSTEGNGVQMTLEELGWKSPNREIANRALSLLNYSKVEQLLAAIESDDSTSHAKYWAINRLSHLCERPEDFGTLLVANDGKILKQIQALGQSGELHVNEFVDLIKLARRVKLARVKIWLLSLLDSPIDPYCQSIAIFDLGQYSTELDVQARLEAIVSQAEPLPDPRLVAQAKRALALSD